MDRKGKEPSTGSVVVGARMVVAVDGSQESAVALAWASAETDRFGAVVPVTVWRYPPWAVGRPRPGAPVARPEADFINAAKRQSRLLLGAIPVRDRHDHLVKEGAAGRTLVKIADGADLLVIGSRGRGATASTFLGSVSGYCVANATVPVVVVPSPQRTQAMDRVVVGVDGSQTSIDALSWTLRHTPPHHQIDVVHAINPDHNTDLIDTEVGDRVAAQLLEDTIRDARQRTHNPNPADLVARIESGHPHEVLRAAAAESDMLVVGAQGVGRLTHLLVGSVTTSLCNQPASVTVVVPGQR